MKLQNMTIIFIIIMIPIILVVSYYIGLQIKTIAIQNSYNTKLQTSAKDAIQALEINTVEWNSSASNLADSKRRDVLASINTFTTSLSNNLGIGGAGKGRIQSYIPAIAYTMYDGYYIYSASLMKEQITDTNGRTQFNSSNGEILYNGDSSYEYVLKPYSPYSARYKDNSNNIDITVNYTLDNYIRVYGTIGSDYVTKEGYLVVPDDPNVGVTVTNGKIDDIKYRQGKIEPEDLKENVHFIDDDKNSYKEEYIYIYDQNDNKLYWDNDNNNFFTINKDNKREFLQPALSIDNPAFSISNRFRKISVPYKDTTDGEWKIQKIFQILNPGGDFKFYTEDAKFYGDKTTKIGERDIDIKKDFSAINYCTESYVFTQWVNSKLKNIIVDNMVNGPTDEKYNNVDSTTKIFEISSANNPDPENDSAYETSPLAQHKKDVIINTLENNLAQATAEAQAANVNYDYRLPRLSYEEWEQALSNISIIAFMQGIPTGLKYYNNYAIATSTLNKEYVDPDELYFCNNIEEDNYYHQRNCIEAKKSSYTGYRSIDYVTKSYEESGNTKYYYLHNGKDNITKDYASLACYHCLVNRATYTKVESGSDPTKYEMWTNQYYKALARERYMQLDSPEGKYIPEVTKFTVTKNVDKPQVYYGDTITYTITVKNNSTNKKTNVLITDEFSQKLNDFININTVLDESGSSLAYTTGEKTIEITIPEIDVGAEKTIKIRGNIKGNVGNYSNVAKIIDSEKEFLSNQVTVNVIKDVTILATSIMPPANIVFIIDSSTSMVGRKIRNVQNAVKDFVNKMPNKGGSQIGYVKFYTVGFYFVSFPYGSENGPYTMQQKDKFINKLEFGFDANPLSLTPFATGLKSGKKLIDKMKSINSNMNIAIFLSDGVNFSIEIPNYKQRAKELQSVTDRVYAIGYGTGVTNFETLRDDIASKKEYFKVGEDMDKVFKDIYDDIADINVDQNISGTTLIESAHYIDGTGNMSGKWIRLENDSDYNFKIDDENKMNGIEINTTKIRIKENEVAIGSNDGKTLVEWSGLGYIGKSSGSLYLNLSKFGPASKVEIEIVQ